MAWPVFAHGFFGIDNTIEILVVGGGGCVVGWI
jgi:hypothetical protein